MVYFIYFSCNLSNNIFQISCLKGLMRYDKGALETIVDEDEEGDSDIEID